MTGGYIGGLMRAIQLCRALALHARNAGQTGDGPDALEKAARAIQVEADQEKTPPMGMVICQTCGNPHVRTT